VSADPVRAYAQAVAKGKPLAGRPVRLACERHLRDLREQETRGLEWRGAEAQRAIAFFGDMLVREDGEPLALMPWQKFIVGSLFGWYNADGSRRYRTAYIETGKGSGKTCFAAGIGLYCLLADGEPAPEVYSAATAADQAAICWKDARRMVEASPDLRALVDVQVGSLTIPADSAVFRPVSSEHRGLDGKRVHCAIVDELHEHPSAIVVDKMRAGTKTRQRALVFEITNSGWDRTSVCWEHHQLSMRVLEGVVQNDGWFAYVCALDPCEEHRQAGKLVDGCDGCDDWRDERVWVKANPGLGTVLPPTYLRELVQDAITMPSKQNIVKRLNFCVWTEQDARWLDMALWERGAGAVEFDARAPCFAGLRTSTTDLSSFVLLSAGEGGGYSLRCRFWLPAGALEDKGRAEETRAQFRAWADAGRVTLTTGTVTDYDAIERDLLAEVEGVNLQALTYDRYGTNSILSHLEALWGTEPDSVPYVIRPLDREIPPACGELERLLIAGLLKHGGHPVLRWMAANVSVRQDGDGNVRPDLGASGDNVTGITALVTALTRAMVRPVHDEQRSGYEDEGLWEVEDHDGA
jgi:phage terminase large subunit-like protein